MEAPPSLLPGLPHASLLLPIPPSRRLRAVTIALSLALACAWIWAIAVVAMASREVRRPTQIHPPRAAFACPMPFRCTLVVRA